MNIIEKLLFEFPHKTINLSSLESLLKEYCNSYQEFADLILELESTGVLVMIKSQGRNTRTPSLALRYRIQKNIITSQHQHQLQKYRATLHKAINIDYYYGKHESIWEEALPYIEKINEYIQKYSLPQGYANAPERSFQLVNDEKWIEAGGRKLLEILGLYELMKILPAADPLMFALNPDYIHKSEQLHLIVENKTTYQGLVPVLTQTQFSTLIYGRGKAGIKSIEQFSMQYPIKAHHYFFYFGDLDRTGISIWSAYNQKSPTLLALPFYQACLQKEAATGKQYQQRDIQAEKDFMRCFPEGEQVEIANILQAGKYHPQEALSTLELQKIWRETDWKVLISGN